MAVWELDEEYEQREDFPEADANADFDWQVRTKLNLPISFIRYATLAGVSFPNPDGTRRIDVIAGCKYAEVLDLAVGLDPRFPEGIAIRTNAGIQLGWIDSDYAQTMFEEVKKAGKPVYACIFRRPTRHPVDGLIMGAVVCLIRLDEKRLP
jgi:hypothetical protein